GTGKWNTTEANFQAGPTNGPWADGGRAVFGATSPGGTVFLGTGTTPGNVAPGGTGTTNATAGVVVESANNFTFTGGAITAGTLYKGGSGSLTLANAPNSLDTVTLAGGTLALNGTNTIGTLA